MNYKECCEFLTDDEFREWEIEMIINKSNLDLRSRLDFLDRDFSGFPTFISSSFTWCETKSGSEYWMELYSNR